jgi:hypothetical protein
MKHPKNANDIIERGLLRRGVEPKLSRALASPKTEADRALAQVVLGKLYLGKPPKAAAAGKDGAA